MMHRAFAVALAALACHCARAPAPQGPASGAAGAEARQESDEVVRQCVSTRLGAVLAEQAPKLGPTCGRPGDAMAKQLFEAGAYSGMLKGTARARQRGLLVAVKQFAVAEDVAAKIAARGDAEVKKADDEADAAMRTAIARIAGDPCVVQAVATAIAEEGARCGAASPDTDEYAVEFARAYGAICEHTVAADECARRADAEYRRAP
jgi:hypothetical protein